MEFPDLGQYCSNKTCNQLDFLPVKCDACNSVFCNDHFTYTAHECPNAALRDNQVPVCPLCNIPIPCRRGELPDIRVGAHIDTECASDLATTSRNKRKAQSGGEKIFKNKCSLQGCKAKELIPCRCDDCGSNYCLKHRHPTDHKCDRGAAARQKAAVAASSRLSNASSNPWSVFSSASRNITNSFSRPLHEPRPHQAAASLPSPTTTKTIQGNLSEDEALARALHESLNPSSAGRNDASQPKATIPTPKSAKEEDEMLRLALVESQQPAVVTATGPASNSRNGRNVDKCSLS